MDDIFTEIQEDLQRERLVSLWKTYSAYIIGAVVAAIIGTAGWAYWRHHEQQILEAEAASYSRALKAIQDKKFADALVQLQALSDKATPTYKALADLQRAGLLLEEAFQQKATAAQRRQDALAIYRQVGQNTRIDAKLRDLAVLLSLYARVDQDDPRELRKGVQPLVSAPHQPWYPLALELQALLDTKAGDRGQAQTLYQDLTTTQENPQGLRARAHAMKMRLEQH